MTAFMRHEIFTGIHAPSHRNPEKYRINRGRSATNADSQTGTQGAEWLMSAISADVYQLIYTFHLPIITVVTVNAFSPRTRVLF